MKNTDQRDIGGARLRLLVIDDEELLASSVCRYFTRVGWAADFRTTPEAGIEAALRGRYDVLVVDHDLRRERTSVDVVRDARQGGCSAVIIIYTGVATASDDAVEAIKAGADDHVRKEQGIEELHRRIEMGMARGPTPSVLRCGPVALHERTKRITLNGKLVGLTHQEWLVLFRLLQSNNEEVEAEELCRFAGIQAARGHKNLANQVDRLRHALDQVEPGAGNMIETVHGVGYRIVEPDAGDPTQ